MKSLHYNALQQQSHLAAGWKNRAADLPGAGKRCSEGPFPQFNAPMPGGTTEAIGAMGETAFPSLLPQGLRDVLPPDAAHESLILGQLTQGFTSWGYQRVDPPLLEFEDTLLEGPGAKMAAQTFRLMDPQSQRIMGARADMTPQIARIAATRLADAPRPLRLFYAGQILRVRGSQLRPERQFLQTGIELIGCDRADADAEVILVAWEVLTTAGITGLSVDISLPTVVREVIAAATAGGAEGAALRSALERKDAPPPLPPSATRRPPACCGHGERLTRPSAFYRICPCRKRPGRNAPVWRRWACCWLPLRPAWRLPWTRRNIGVLNTRMASASPCSCAGRGVKLAGGGVMPPGQRGKPPPAFRCILTPCCALSPLPPGQRASMRRRASTPPLRARCGRMAW